MQGWEGREGKEGSEGRRERKEKRGKKRRENSIVAAYRNIERRLQRCGSITFINNKVFTINLIEKQVTKQCLWFDFSFVKMCALYV